MTTAPDDAGRQYTAALGELHAARQAVVRGRTSAQARLAHREQALRDLAGALAGQQERLQALAHELGAPVPAEHLTALPGAPPMPWDAGEADARTRIASAGRAVEEARRIGRLPQLLPQWSGQLGRAAVVYLACTVPQLVLGSLTFQITNSQLLTAWFWVLAPVTITLAGAIVIGRVSRPRIDPDQQEQLLARLRPVKRYPWLGLIIVLGCEFGLQRLLEAIFGAAS